MYGQAFSRRNEKQKSWKRGRIVTGLLSHGSTRIVFVIKEKALRFADIISSKVELDHTSVQYAAKPVETSDVDMTSLLTRSAIGSFLGGNVGMLIGGLSAKRKKTVQMVPDSIANNYCLIIETTLNQHPTKKFQFYEDIDLARRVSKTINRTLNTYKQEKKRMS